MNRALLLIAMLIAEAAFGYPRRWLHPVQAAGALIERVEQRLNHGSAFRRRLAGISLVTLLIALSILIGRAIELVAGRGWGQLAAIAAGTAGLAQRSLYEHVAALVPPLGRSDLTAAQAKVGQIVGRDTAPLDESGIATAAIESLAESFCDGVVAPALWFLVGGLPGLFAAKAINTADSMVGHRTPELADFGWAAARADDLVNWLPARIAGLLICVAAGRGWRTMVRDSGKHPSPNGGWPEAAIAGALGRRLGGPVTYDGELIDRGVLGCGPSPRCGDIRRALSIYCRACGLLWAVAGGLAWAL